MKRIVNIAHDHVRSSRAGLVAAFAATVLLVAGPVGSAQAAFGIEAFDGTVSASPAGDAYTQAGGHPFDISTDIAFNTTPLPPPLPLEVADGDPKTIRVDAPPGLVGNPQAAPLCEPIDFFSGDLLENKCPIDTQVGVAALDVPGYQQWLPVYSLRPAIDSIPAAFGFTAGGVPVIVEATVRSGSDYGISLTSARTNQGLTINAVRMTLWGIPGSREHDGQRCKVLTPRAGVYGCWSDATDPRQLPNSVSYRPAPLLTLPTTCTAPGVGLETKLTVDSWADPGAFHTASFVSHLPPGYPSDSSLWGPPQGPEGCDAVPFEPSADVRPAIRAASEPTGLNVDLDVPQDGLSSPNGLATAHVRKVAVTLPEGMSINPAAADGLQACSDDQLGFGNEDDPACPEASKVGTVAIDTPVLKNQLQGSVYVAEQRSSEPSSGEMFRLFLVAKAPGVSIKLRGSVRPDERTGQLTTTFDGNPQLPFSKLHLELKGGPRAPLANPASCGEKTTTTEFTSWSGKTAVSRSSFTVPCTGGLGGFAPSLAAGTMNPAAGAMSPFALRIRKPDTDSDIDGLSLSLPEGLLANLKGNVGTRVGTARVAAGPGASPFWLSGAVILEGPYGDAPFSLRVTVPAVAGPFDLGEVVVRQKIYVDPETAAVRVVSDPLPTIVKGVPVRLQHLAVDVDKPGFVRNPTDCSPKGVAGTLRAATGQTASVSARFQAADCTALAFKPKMAMRLSGGKQTRTGGHPAFTTTLRQGKGQANIGAVKVTMPSSIALDANNSSDKALVCDYDKAQQADCPASSIIGQATAYTPVLNRPLTGPVHLVQGIKFGPKGNRIRTTPALLVKLRGEVAVNLRGQTTTEKGTNRLVTTFAKVPDAPVSRFDLKVNGGSKGILVVTRTRRGKINLCSGRQIAAVETDGQNGKRADFQTRVKTPCGKAAKAKRRR